MDRATLALHWFGRGALTISLLASATFALGSYNMSRAKPEHWGDFSAEVVNPGSRALAGSHWYDRPSYIDPKVTPLSEAKPGEAPRWLVVMPDGKRYEVSGGATANDVSNYALKQWPPQASYRNVSLPDGRYLQVSSRSDAEAIQGARDWWSSRYWSRVDASVKYEDQAILWLVSGALFFGFTRLVRWILMGGV